VREGGGEREREREVVYIKYKIFIWALEHHFHASKPT